ncbi:MAG: hypothetical protein PVJ92_03230, partial [Candidatus Dependentiae bacterium]
MKRIIALIEYSRNQKQRGRLSARALLSITALIMGLSVATVNAMEKASRSGEVRAATSAAPGDMDRFDVNDHPAGRNKKRCLGGDHRGFTSSGREGGAAAASSGRSGTPNPGDPDSTLSQSAPRTSHFSGDDDDSFVSPSLPDFQPVPQSPKRAVVSVRPGGVPSPKTITKTMAPQVPSKEEAVSDLYFSQSFIPMHIRAIAKEKKVRERAVETVSTSLAGKIDPGLFAALLSG